MCYWLTIYLFAEIHLAYFNLLICLYVQRHVFLLFVLYLFSTVTLFPYAYLVYSYQHCRMFNQMILSHQTRLKTHRGKKSRIRNILSNVWISVRRRSSNRLDHDVTNITIPIVDFEPEIFQHLMTYVHTGTVHIKPSTVVGKHQSIIHPFFIKYFVPLLFVLFKNYCNIRDMGMIRANLEGVNNLLTFFSMVNFLPKLLHLECGIQLTLTFRIHLLIPCPENGPGQDDF